MSGDDTADDLVTEGWNDAASNRTASDPTHSSGGRSSDADEELEALRAEGRLRPARLEALGSDEFWVAIPGRVFGLLVIATAGIIAFVHAEGVADAALAALLLLLLRRSHFLERKLDAQHTALMWCLTVELLELRSAVGSPKDGPYDTNLEETAVLAKINIERAQKRRVYDQIADALVWLAALGLVWVWLR